MHRGHISKLNVLFVWVFFLHKTEFENIFFNFNLMLETLLLTLYALLPLHTRTKDQTRCWRLLEVSRRGRESSEAWSLAFRQGAGQATKVM